jgi:hypothetical protein
MSLVKIYDCCSVSDIAPQCALFVITTDDLLELNRELVMTKLHAF